MAGFRKCKFDGAVLMFERGGHHHEDQEDNENVNQRHDNDRGR